MAWRASRCQEKLGASGNTGIALGNWSHDPPRCRRLNLWWTAAAGSKHRALKLDTTGHLQTREEAISSCVVQNEISKRAGGRDECPIHYCRETEKTAHHMYTAQCTYRTSIHTHSPNTYTQPINTIPINTWAHKPINTHTQPISTDTQPINTYTQPINTYTQAHQQ